MQGTSHRRRSHWYTTTLTLASFLGAICISLLQGCAEGSSNNAANVPYNSNTSANTIASTPYPSNSTSNTAANTANANIDQLSEKVTFDMLSDALRERIKGSGHNAKIFTENQWQKNVWLNQTIGRFYKDDDDFAKKAVCAVTENILREHNRRMINDALPRLRDSINHGLMCRKVVLYMQEATLNTQPIDQVP